jgi:hypothetical protein
MDLTIDVCESFQNIDPSDTESATSEVQTAETQSGVIKRDLQREFEQLVNVLHGFDDLDELHGRCTIIKVISLISLLFFLEISTFNVVRPHLD